MLSYMDFPVCTTSGIETVHSGGKIFRIKCTAAEGAVKSSSYILNINVNINLDSI